jgi:hypothetical protein
LLNFVFFFHVTCRIYQFAEPSYKVTLFPGKRQALAAHKPVDKSLQAVDKLIFWGLRLGLNHVGAEIRGAVDNFKWRFDLDGDLLPLGVMGKVAQGSSFLYFRLKQRPDKQSYPTLTTIA